MSKLFSVGLHILKEYWQLDEIKTSQTFDPRYLLSADLAGIHQMEICSVNITKNVHSTCKERSLINIFRREVVFRAVSMLYFGVFKYYSSTLVKTLCGHV